WVRYRALLSVLPDWLASYARGRAVLGIDAANPPSYRMTAGGRNLAELLSASLDNLAAVAARANASAVADLEAKPRPIGAIRRIPQI
ncbi:MAG TPA: hypothetical protein VEQ37_15885, partial [Actinomycetota bacterium]|nr:hypothetical protein [Actinomycetota bacterium]